MSSRHGVWYTCWDLETRKGDLNCHNVSWPCRCADALFDVLIMICVVQCQSWVMNMWASNLGIWNGRHFPSSNVSSLHYTLGRDVCCCCSSFLCWTTLSDSRSTLFYVFSWLCDYSSCIFTPWSDSQGTEQIINAVTMLSVVTIKTVFVFKFYNQLCVNMGTRILRVVFFSTVIPSNHRIRYFLTVIQL